MDKARLVRLCRSKRGATWDFPFDETTMCVRIGGKIFALIFTDASPAAVNLKCDPAMSRDLRSVYASIAPGYHMNHEHWITVTLGGDAPDDLVASLIEASYQIVRDALGPRAREKAGLPPKPRKAR